MRYIVVTGGVVSGLGKGITISSIGRLLKLSGVSVTSIKIDPYLNTDAGTMSPFEHGEVFVLDDGGEGDLDLGNYERFLGVTLSGKHNITTGKIYQSVIEQERRGEYLGKTVQVVPHVTDRIQEWIETVAHQPVDGSGEVPDVCLVEVGGTVGDIESMVFLEALRQFQFRVGRENCMFVHLSLVPVLGSVGEQKTKPTQHSVQELRKVGLSPDVIVCRSTQLVDESTRRKISVFCHVAPDHVLSVHDVSNIYHVPLLLAEQNLHAIIKRRLLLDKMGEPELAEWRLLAERVDKLDTAPVVRIAIVGKYTGLQDSYLSVIKSLQHSAIQLDRKLQLAWIEATDLEEQSKLEVPEKYNAAWEILRNVDGIVVPGGFGSRGVEGKILTARFARENKVPILGVCLGFQVMVIEAARHLLNWEGANSTEINEEANPACIVFMPEVSKTHMGGTMRLGARATVIRPTLGSGEPSIAADVYGKVEKVMERHRHRYEVNPELIDQLETSGLCFTGKDETGQRMEIAELPRSQHPFYFGVQFHPEFKSRPRHPSPPFFGLVAVASGQPERIGEVAPTILSSGASPPASPTRELLEATQNA